MLYRDSAHGRQGRGRDGTLGLCMHLRLRVGLSPWHGMTEHSCGNEHSLRALCAVLSGEADNKAILRMGAPGVERLPFPSSSSLPS